MCLHFYADDMEIYLSVTASDTSDFPKDGCVSQ